MEEHGAHGDVPSPTDSTDSSSQLGGNVPVSSIHSDEGDVIYPGSRRGHNNMHVEQNPLGHTYTIWYFIGNEDEDKDHNHNNKDKDKADDQHQENFSSKCKKIGSFSTVEEFWSLYSHLKRVNTTDNKSPDYFLFKDDIKPMWEDQANINGGQLCTLFCHSNSKYHPNIGRIWEDLILAFIGEQFEAHDDICGISVKVRSKRCTESITVWNRDSTNQNTLDSIRSDVASKISYVVPPAYIQVIYSVHQELIEQNVEKGLKGDNSPSMSMRKPIRQTNISKVQLQILPEQLEQQYTTSSSRSSEESSERQSPVPENENDGQQEEPRKSYASATGNNEGPEIKDKVKRNSWPTVTKLENQD